MTKRNILAAFAVLVAGPAFAQTAMDTDGDGYVSLGEIQTAHPEVTADGFAEMDTDGDGLLSLAEVEAAIAAGTLDA